MHGDAAVRLDAVELRQEVDVEVRAPELAVGDAAQPEVLLELDDAANRLVLHLAKRGSVQRARLELVARVEQEFRPEEAADVVGAKGRRCATAEGGRRRGWAHDVLRVLAEDYVTRVRRSAAHALRIRRRAPAPAARVPAG